MDDLFRSSTSNHKLNTTNVFPKLFACLVFKYFDSYLMKDGKMTIINKKIIKTF
jgi:hypothetical protein